MEADLLLLEGKDEAAEEMSHHCLRLAETRRQDSIAFCAELTLARIAVLRGDAEGFSKWLKSIRRRSGESTGAAAADMYRAFLASMLGMDDELPQWMRGLESIRESVCASAAPFAHIACARTLLRTAPVEFRKAAPVFIEETKRWPRSIKR